jgi:hypothetical protein
MSLASPLSKWCCPFALPDIRAAVHPSGMYTVKAKQASPRGRDSLDMHVTWARNVVPVFELVCRPVSCCAPPALCAACVLCSYCGLSSDSLEALAQHANLRMLLLLGTASRDGQDTHLEDSPGRLFRTSVQGRNLLMQAPAL